MEKWLNEKALPVVMKFVNTRPMTALKNGMLFALPFLVTGSLFLILAQLPNEGLQTWMNGLGNGHVVDTFWKIYNATMNLSAMFAVVGIAFAWTEDAGFPGLPAGLTALVSMLIVNPSTIDSFTKSGKAIKGVDAVTAIIPQWLGGQGMITAILVGMFAGGVYSWFLKKGITIKLPDSVPTNVASSFTALIPAFVISLISGIVYTLFSAFGNTSLVELIYKLIQTPLQHVSDGPVGVLVVSLLPVLFWIFGVHGTVIIGGIMGPLLQANNLDNAALYAKHDLTIANGAHIVTQAFMDQMITFTGTGITIGLTIYFLLWARSKQLKVLGRLEIGPAIFNINEPLLFGTPVVLNPLFFVPFIVTPVLSGFATYFLIKFGILPPFNGTMVPWTTPPIVSGLIVGGWQHAIWQVIIMIGSVFVYLPFARKYDAILVKQENGESTEEIIEEQKKD
jgi:PTS system cellobiose-specific IIC component